MVTRADIIVEARRWKDVPYKHQGRNKYGLDCCGLVITIGNRLGLFDYTDFWYSPQPDGVKMEAECDKTLGPVQSIAKPGDIGLFWVAHRKFPQHMGVFVPYGNSRNKLAMVHAFSTVGKVSEHRFDEFWQKRLVKAYAFPGIE